MPNISSVCRSEEAGLRQHVLVSTMVGWLGIFNLVMLGFGRHAILFDQVAVIVPTVSHLLVLAKAADCQPEVSLSRLASYLTLDNGAPGPW